MARRARMPNRLIDSPPTRRRRVRGEVFGYPGTRSQYLEGEPTPPERVPGDPAQLERGRRPQARTERLRASRRKRAG